MAKSLIRLGVDIGGTFTDLVLEHGDARFSAKVLTTSHAPEAAILDGMQQICAKARIRPPDIGQIIHGTTLATNALIERRGAKTALITTTGFRDVIEMRTESRFEQYDLNLAMPEPLLARQQRYTIDERIDASGNVLIAPDLSQIDAVLEQISAAGYESIAVGLIHSYVNNSHERLLRDRLAQHLPGVTVSLSSEVSPQMREYERFNTVVANAYIKPLIKTYLERLQTRLADLGVGCPVFLMHSGGGIISLESAAEFPVRLVESGPAGGAVFAADLAARYQLPRVLSFDMGGTTAKICLIRDHTPKTSRVFEVARSYRFKKGSGMPISIPVIDMVEIGAGGGSLASVDAMRQIRVGPQSAGSNPGPACYARGGDQPAVTDADLMLGRLDPDHFAGGSMPLDANAAASALSTHLGAKLEMDALTAAYGLCEVVDENMANAARVHAVENGEDLSQYTMIAFGGAAPLHAARLCEKLGIDRLLIPTGAGVGSAIGFLRAPFSFEANRSKYMRLSDFDAAQVRDLFAQLQQEATGFVRSCDADSPISCEFKAYGRYSGQGWEIPIVLTPELAAAPEADALEQLFEQAYRNLFDRTVESMDIEFTVFAVNAYTAPAQVEPVPECGSHSQASAVGTRSLFDPALGELVDAAVYQRQRLVTGEQMNGPAAITEDETTIIVPSSRKAVCQADGCIEISRKDQE